MEPCSFQEALQDPKPTSDALDDLVSDWNSHLSEDIETITLWQPLRPCPWPAPCYTVKLHEMMQDLRWPEQVWHCMHDEATRICFKMCMKTYEMAVKATKKDF